MNLPCITRRAFDDCPAVIWRGKYDVVIDRDLLPKLNDNGTICCEEFYRFKWGRWILYSDLPQTLWFGEWRAFRTRKSALEFAKNR